MHKDEQVKYVAKKVILEGLGDKEQAGCMMEAGLLKNLEHPNIVAYKESFLGNNSLIIIMEYCDGKSLCEPHTFYRKVDHVCFSGKLVGDLAYHIKRK